MLTIMVLGQELWDEKSERFTHTEGFELQLEHSLVSLSKWESKFEKPFLSEGEKSDEEALGYIEAMILTPDYPSDIVYRLSEDNVMAINEYMNAKMTASWFNEVQPEARNSETITNELIYYWMDMFGIKIECQDWHLNRLFTLIKIHNLKASKPKPMGRSDRMAWQREMNARRKKELGTSG